MIKSTNTQTTVSNNHIDMRIEYGYVESPFGKCFIAFADDGICALHFPDSELEKEDLLNQLRKAWSKAGIIENKPLAQHKINEIFSKKGTDVNLLLRGTPFQLNVWHALVQIPFGKTVTYSEVAQLIGNPKAVRAAATAVASNPVCYLVPCHRVVRKSGDVGKYRWKTERKIRLLEWEHNNSILEN